MANYLKAHRSRLVRDYIDSLAGHVHVEFLPIYAPEQPRGIHLGVNETPRHG